MASVILMTDRQRGTSVFPAFLFVYFSWQKLSVESHCIIRGYCHFRDFLYVCTAACYCIDTLAGGLILGRWGKAFTSRFGPAHSKDAGEFLGGIADSCRS